MNKWAWKLYFAIKQCLIRVSVLIRATHVVHTERVYEVISILKPWRTQHELVRFGGDSDGGYLIPDDLEGIEYCFSPGVSNFAGFEIDLEKKGIKSYLADYSVDKMPFGLSDAVFMKKFITSQNGPSTSTLENWLKQSIGCNYQKDLILQMDVEGSEYEVFLQTSDEVLKKFRIIVVEFHGLHGVFDKIQAGLVEHVFRKVTKHFYVVHLHPNNFSPPLRLGSLEIPDILEVTLLRKDRALTKPEKLEFPHPLDRKCSPGRADYALPACWYDNKR